MAGLTSWALTDIQVARKTQFIYLFSVTLRICQQVVLWFDGGVFASPVVGVSARCTDTSVQVRLLTKVLFNCNLPESKLHFLIFTVAKPCLHRHPLRHTWRQDRYIAYICFTFCGWFYHKGHCLSLTDTFSLIQIIILSNGRNIIHSRTSSSDLVVAQAAVNSSLVNIVWSPGQNFQKCVVSSQNVTFSYWKNKKCI